jgi:hypothetical protein
VHVDGRRVTSCLTLALLHDGREIMTIEGLGTPDALHPMQAAFLAYDGTSSARRLTNSATAANFKNSFKLARTPTSS